MSFSVTKQPALLGVVVFGNVAVVFAIGDVNEAKEEEVLRMHEEKYKMIFDNAPIGIYQSTVDGKYITANKAFASILGYGSPESLMESVSNIAQQIYINPKDRQRTINLLKEHDHCTVEVQIKRKDGTIAWIMNQVRSVRYDRGRVVYYEGAAQDITDQKKTEGDLLLMRARDIMLMDSILLSGRRS
ncbi:MAG: PAS domain-containing protein [Deltaproteobacteria bacterium]|nr:PAS domain-containing protein [Deltaproteobacteria bacterium]